MEYLAGSPRAAKIYRLTSFGRRRSNRKMEHAALRNGRSMYVGLEQHGLVVVSRPCPPPHIWGFLQCGCR